MTTKEAFKELVNIRGWWIGILTSAQSANMYKIRFKNGTLSHDTMINFLEKSKIFNKVQDIEWTKINQLKK